MTPKQKTIKLELLKAMIQSANFKLDNYGNYKYSFKEVQYRIKLKPINIRVERKSPGSTLWHKIISQPIVAIDEIKLGSWLAKFI